MLVVKLVVLSLTFKIFDFFKPLQLSKFLEKGDIFQKLVHEIKTVFERIWLKILQRLQKYSKIQTVPFNIKSVLPDMIALSDNIQLQHF